MSSLPKIGIVGASGRMGQMLIKAIADSEKMELFAVTEMAGHTWVGKSLIEINPETPHEIMVLDNPEEAFGEVDAVIDFSSPNSSTNIADLASRLNFVHVVGTTGIDRDQEASIVRSSKSAVIIKAGNMSMGVNLLVKITEMVAASLDADFDIEIVEAHHHHKVDAPSGTALMLGEAAASGRKVDLSDHMDKPRYGAVGARKRGNIGFSAIRGGNIVGEHDVIFAGNGEKIVLSHIATDRSIYSSGALKAALWGLDQSPGLYDIFDVLGI